MSGDLISKQALLKEIKEKIIPDKYGTSSAVLDVMGAALRVIGEQPTAYDVDKVVERLERIKTDNSCTGCTYREKCDELQEYYNPNDETDLCALVTKELALEIVKSGGIEQKLNQ